MKFIQLTGGAYAEMNKQEINKLINDTSNKKNKIIIKKAITNYNNFILLTMNPNIAGYLLTLKILNDKYNNLKLLKISNNLSIFSI